MGVYSAFILYPNNYSTLEEPKIFKTLLSKFYGCLLFSFDKIIFIRKKHLLIYKIVKLFFKCMWSRISSKYFLKFKNLYIIVTA